MKRYQVRNIGKTLRKIDDRSLFVVAYLHLQSLHTILHNSLDFAARHTRHRYLHKRPFNGVMFFNQLVYRIGYSNNYDRGVHAMIRESLDGIRH